MSQLKQDINPLAGQLEQALGQGTLPSEYAEWGSQLLHRLAKPVQVAVIGQPGSGKSAVIDMMLGRTVVSTHDAAPIIELRYGEQEQCVFELNTGQVLPRPGILAGTTVPDGTVRVRQELPDQRLLNHSFTEVSLTGSGVQKQALLQQTVSQADVVLWCSETFDFQDQALWSAVPDEKKDHSFLVLTMADRQIMRGTLSDLLSELEPVAAEEFLGVYPLATVQAIQAQTAGAGLNAELWKSSGGKQLAGDVLHQIEMGRASDVDQAEMLVRQFAAKPETPACAPEAVESVAPQVAAPPPPPSAQGNDLLNSALGLLQDRAKQMLAESDGGHNVDSEQVLNSCVDAVRALSDTLAQERHPSPELRSALDAAQDGEELMMLFQLERGEDAAIDAVTLLLQLKKEIGDDVKA